jgi:hypothetical protein
MRWTTKTWNHVVPQLTYPSGWRAFRMLRHLRMPTSPRTPMAGESRLRADLGGMGRSRVYTATSKRPRRSIPGPRSSASREAM